jgi:hypothetical protein
MSDKEIPPTLMSAIVTEHFALQSMASSTIGESGSRAAIYLSALSSALVAIGFASSTPETLQTLALTVLPTVFILGCFTIVRLVDTSVENIVALNRITRIRNYYGKMHPDAAALFGVSGGKDMRAVRYRSSSMLFTMASMIILVNSVLGGATVALSLVLTLGLATPTAALLGGTVGIVIVCVSLLYQRHRLAPLIAENSDAGSSLPAGSELA